MGARILYVPKCSEEGCRGWQLKMDLVPVRVFGRGASSLRLLAFGSRDATFDLKCDTVCAGHTKAGGIAANLAGMACLQRQKTKKWSVICRINRKQDSGIDSEAGRGGGGGGVGVAEVVAHRIVCFVVGQPRCLGSWSWRAFWGQTNGGQATGYIRWTYLTRSRSSLSPEAWLSRCICGRSVGRGGRRVRRGPGIWLQAILRMLVALAGRQVDLHNDDKTCCNSIV
jgi:hypothetical protein